jgi:hypothetical protein
MSKPCTVLVLTVGLALLLAGCNRRGDQKRANSHPTEQPSLVKSSSADPSLASSSLPSAAPQSENASAVEQERPSPFLPPPAAQRPAPQTAARTQSAGSLQSASRAPVATKPFTMPTASAINMKGGTLPPPPTIRQSAPDAVALAPFRETTCCTATATYEPAKPNSLQRVMHKVPGLRRLDPSSTGGKGFVPPRPIHEIQFAFPPGASPAFLQKKHMDLKASVDASGHVTRVELLSPRDEDLVKLAAYAANEWHFAPAELNDQPVPGKIILHFSLDTNSTAQAAVDKSKRQ